VAEFSYTGSCLRALGPLGIPLYRIPHSVPASAIRSLAAVATGEVTYRSEPASTPEA
jgi:hypothetical protein